jgi:hypothetical protein
MGQHRSVKVPSRAGEVKNLLEDIDSEFGYPGADLLRARPEIKSLSTKVIAAVQQ